MEAHSANILRKSGRGASWEGGYVRAGAGQVEGWVPVRPARMASRWWGAASFPGTGCGGVSGAGRGSGCAASPGGGCRVADRGLGPVCSWSRQGVGMSGVGRCAADRRCRVVGQQGGCRVGAGRCGPLGAARAGVDSLFRRGRHGAAAVSERGRSHPPGRSPCFGVEPLFRRARHRVDADRWERRGSAWTLCSGGAGMEPPPFPDGPVASPGRKASHLRAQRPPEGARCSVFGLFLSFSAASRRAGTDAVCKSAVSPLGKSEKVVFLFLLYN